MSSTISPITLDHAVVGPPQGQWTYADWERLPDDGNRYEVFNGRLYMSTAPSHFHQLIVTRLIRNLGMPLGTRDLGMALFAPVGVILSPIDAVQPDFLVILQSNDIIRNRRVMGAPNLVVEVLSSGNSSIEMDNKRDAYARGGVPEYAVADPVTRIVYQYRLREPGEYGEAHIFGDRDTLIFDCLPMLPLSIGMLFADIPTQGV